MEKPEQLKNENEVPVNFSSMSQAEKEAMIGEALRAGVKELVIHGDKIKDKEGKEIFVLRPDLDCRTAIYLVDLANIDYNQLTFVPKGEWIPGKIHIDTGERPAFDIEEDGSVFFDHHGTERAERGQSTCAAKMFYEVLVRQGLLKKEEWLDTLVNFVTDIDNADYPLDRESFKNEWWRSLYGMQKAISFDSLVNLIKAGKDPRKPFDKEVAEKSVVQMANGKEAPLIDVCMKQQWMVDNSLKGIRSSVENMRASGIKDREPRLFGNVLFNLIKAPEVSEAEDKKAKSKNLIPLGFTAARAMGFDSYFLWDEKTGGFFITSQFHLQQVFEIVSTLYPEAKIIRGTMIMYKGDEKVAEGNQKFSPDVLLQNLGLKS